MRLFQSRPTRLTKATLAKDTVQLVVFQLHNDRFALPVEVMQRVVTLKAEPGQLAEIPDQVQYGERQVKVIDLAQRIYGSTATNVGSASELLPPEQLFLVIIEDSQGNLVSFPIDSAPVLRRIERSVFTPLPPTYGSLAGIRYVTSLYDSSKPDDPSFFLLDHERLVKVELMT